MFDFSDTSLEQDVGGIHFTNPIGLAAGFDKNAELLDIIPSVGFGFMEVGSITAEPCEGNPKPRLWRLPKSKSLVVYYGLKNDGAEYVYHRVENRRRSIPVGTNIAMTNCEDNLNIEHAIGDYAKSFKIFARSGDYFTINVSCPNTRETKKPIFIKLSPDYSFEVIDQILDISKKHRVDGIICTNLTKHPNPADIKNEDVPKVGGLSGKVVQEMSDTLLAYIYRRDNAGGKNRFILIGIGGVFSAADAYKKIRLGANIVQLITGMIFEGPQLISEINRQMVQMLHDDGFTNITEAVGVDA